MNSSPHDYLFYAYQLASLVCGLNVMDVRIVRPGDLETALDLEDEVCEVSSGL